MDLNKFVTDSIRTESRIDQVETNHNLVVDTIYAMVALGNVLDLVKKNTFYKKPIDQDKFNKLVLQAKQGVDSLLVDVECSTASDPSYFKPQEIDPRIFHSVLGIVTEGTELLEAIQLKSKDFDAVNFREELGDILWYVAIGADATGGDMEAIADRVIAKLKARFPQKFTTELANNRNLEVERAILEGKNV